MNTAVITFTKANDAYIFKNQLQNQKITLNDQTFNFTTDFVLNAAQLSAREEYKKWHITLFLRNVPEFMTEGTELKKFLESFGAKVKNIEIRKIQVANQDESEEVRYKASGSAFVYFEDEISTLIIGSKKPEELLFNYETGDKDGVVKIPLEFEYFKLKSEIEKMN